MIELLKRLVPSRQAIESKAFLRPLRPLLNHPEYWYLERRGMRVAVAVGVACCWIPLPVQMIAAVLVSMWMRANVPIAAATTLITNPLTIGPMLYFAYKLGTTLLGVEPTNAEPQLSLDAFLGKTGQVFKPLLLGCLLCASVSTPLAWLIAHVLWRVHAIKRWRERRGHRRARTFMRPPVDSTPQQGLPSTPASPDTTPQSH